MIPNNKMEEEEKYGWAFPTTQGLYDPSLEKDACGVGFVVQTEGKASREIVEYGKQILCRLKDRGAEGADPRDGDGSGIMIAIPHLFFNQIYKDWVEKGEKEKEYVPSSLPLPGLYSIGNIFFSKDESIRNECLSSFESIATELNLSILFWRKAPINSQVLGPNSNLREPFILQPLITLKNRIGTDDEMERELKKKLYQLRKKSTHKLGLTKSFYICTLHTRTMVYKGQLTTSQLFEYFEDLNDSGFVSHFSLVHSRFSTNTFPSWDRAQPMRWCAHNGEINTLQGNINWMKAKEGSATSILIEDLESLFPIIEPHGSDSASFDNVLELLIENGILSIAEAIMMMVPEAWQNDLQMDPKKKAWYQWASCLMEPWDGPALFTFSDGRFIGACLDRNGLRPCRYLITNDNIMICASEVGTLLLDPKTITTKGRLQPGRLLLVDTLNKTIVQDEEVKLSAANRAPFLKHLKNGLFHIEDICSVEDFENRISKICWNGSSIQDPRIECFGFSIEQFNLIILPMLKEGKEGLGSMGHDSELACLSQEPHSIFDYFRQLFAQVTNPPIDPLREEMVMSLECYLGNQGNLLEINSQLQCQKLVLKTPILEMGQIQAIKQIEFRKKDWKTKILDITFEANEIDGYEKTIERICEQSKDAIEEGSNIIILSDARLSRDRIAISALIACGAVHHFLIHIKQRTKVSLIIETGEAREVHHMCVLLGYGADAICPYFVMELINNISNEKGFLDEIPLKKMIENYISSCDHGILKVMSKMGISTLQSYKGAQIFEALGIDKTVIDVCFKGTPSRIGGANFNTLAKNAILLHERGFSSNIPLFKKEVPRETGEYHYRFGGEKHMNTPAGVSNLQDAVRRKSENSYVEYSKEMREQTRHCTLRGMMDFDYSTCQPISIELVEDWSNIVKRFCTGAMSYGSISEEAHSTLAIAMNTIGGKSNTGEGGEDPERTISKDGVSTRSSIKQVASGRFGVTSFYLSDSEELQIKIAQGAKPGEGGELPGHKVSESIAKTRKSTAGVGLISPPPHHDVYSIEDLKQLIYDLKCSNPVARISVKLVSEVGIGVIASGVVKAKAEHLLISGHDGGTGAARWTGIKHAGLPWELGLAETHQTLTLNGLRDKVILQTDGQIKTGRDVAIACLLGSEEWGFATTPLIALGCTMMRKCHLNTCPVCILIL
eukprot:TRINITY_DN7515_c0_g1_i1.p1 TRINITY_DN7515_c0_g1~~TRINITY_DN7515_c0_g1_i1.p1  ORF type:complete len:1182 (-),score=219.23 TRINITY_DN7515_c0_g1_i1:3627-7172(-)